MSERILRAASAAAASIVLTGCANPLLTSPDDYGDPIPLHRTRHVDSLDLAEYAEAPSDAQDVEVYLDEPPPDRLAGLDSYELTIEQARAWTLRNNLDVRVALVDPVIANERITEEEAAFESVFFGSAAIGKAEQAANTSVNAGVFESINTELGLRIPLRTGGEVTLRAPVNRNETNNVFTLINPSFSASPSVSITQPLLRNAGRRANTHGIRVAAYQTGIAEARTKLELVRQLANADRSYWRLYAAHAALRVAKNQYELAKAQLDRADRQLNAGRVAEIEVIRAEEGVAQRIEDIIIAETDLLELQRELKRIMNVQSFDVGSQTLLQTSTSPDPIALALDERDLVEQALENRMELLELELQLSIDASTIDLRENQALPLFTTQYSYGLDSVGSTVSGAFGQLSDRTFENWRLALDFEIPIGNEAAKSRINQAVLERLQRLSTREARRRAIAQETLDAIDNIEAGWQRILAARYAAASAQRTLDAEQRRFDVGRSTSTDVLDAATRLAEAQLAEIRALTNFQVAQVDLAFATGTLLGAARVSWQPLDPRSNPAPEQQSADPEDDPLRRHEFMRGAGTRLGDDLDQSPAG